MNAASKPGFHAGMELEIPVLNKLYFQPGLFFITKGFSKGWKTQIDATAYYLELPLNILFKPDIGKGKLLFSAGPYVEYGLGGKWKTPEINHGGAWIDITFPMYGNLEFTNNASADNMYSIIYGSDYTYGRPFDFGVNVIIGYQFSGNLLVQLNGQMGMANLAPMVDGEK